MLRAAPAFCGVFLLIRRRLEERHAKTIALKQGMMQQLLTGKIRLI
jgi:hypothetical protein